MSRGERRPAGEQSNRRAAIAACLLSLLATACAYSPSPPGWLPTPAQTPGDAYGAWIALTLTNDSTIGGEFLAYERDTVWLLRQDSTVRSEAVAGVKKAQIWWYDSQTGNTGLLTFLGSASTISNGFFLVFTMPIWIITGTYMAAQDSRVPRIEPARTGWEAARIYARYPAGLPPHLPAVLPVRAP